MENKKKCNTCSKAKVKFNWMFGVSIYVFIVFVYGQIELIKKLISLF